MNYILNLVSDEETHNIQNQDETLVEDGYMFSALYENGYSHDTIINEIQFIDNNNIGRISILLIFNSTLLNCIESHSSGHQQSPVSNR